MPTPNSAPFAAAPDELLRLWNKYALRGDLDSRNPPATAEEAYNQVVALQLREMQDVAQEIRQDAEEEALVDGNLRRALAMCTQCGATNLEHFYTAKAGSYVLCPECFHGGVT